MSDLFLLSRCHGRQVECKSLLRHKNDLYTPLIWEENNLSAHILRHNMLGLRWIERTLGSFEGSMIARVLIWKIVVFEPLKQRIGK